jgi:hypothetical protein
VCRSCAEPHAGPVSREALGLLAELGAAGPGKAGAVVVDPYVRREARGLLFGFAEYHLERRMKSLPIMARSLVP